MTSFYFFITLCDFLEFWIAKGFCRNFVLTFTFSFYEYQFYWSFVCSFFKDFSKEYCLLIIYPHLELIVFYCSHGWIFWCVCKNWLAGLASVPEWLQKNIGETDFHSCFPNATERQPEDHWRRNAKILI